MVAGGSAWRARWYPRVVLVALVAGFVIVVLSGSGSDAISGRLGGDYPAFYAAGEIVGEDPEHLYQPELQSERQVGLHGSESGSFLYFSYPPYVALAYSPLAELPYRGSYLLHTILMAGAMVLGLHLLRPLVPRLDRSFEAAAVASLAFYPMFRGITAGQNTGLTLLLLAIALRALHDRRDWSAGAALAALLYKPQFAVPLLGLALLRGRWRAAVGGAVGAVGLYLVGAAVQGWGWLGPWTEQVRWFTELDARVNAHNAISWLGFAEAIWGVGDPVAMALGWTLASATALFLAWAWWRAGTTDMAALAAVTVPGLVLLSPHAMFYDAGLLVVPLLVLAGMRPERRAWLAVLYLVPFVQVWADQLGWSPIFPVVVATFVWSASGTGVLPPAIRLRGRESHPVSSSAA